MHHETSQSMDMAASPAMATSPTLTMDMSPSPASMDMTEVDVHESGDKGILKYSIFFYIYGYLGK